MSLVIVLTVLFLEFSPFYFQLFRSSLISLFQILFQADCLFPLRSSSLLSFYLVLSFVLYFSVFFFFSNLLHLRSPFLLGLYSFFFLVFPFEGKVGWVVCVDFLLGVICACVLVGDQAGSYRNNGTYMHTSTHSYNQSILNKRVQEIGLVNKENKSDINQLKAELTNVQSRKLNLHRVSTVEDSEESSTI